jgi:LuxR family maltose regulon positive regulatory protein
MAEAPRAGQPIRSQPKPRKSRAGPKGRPARSGPDPKPNGGPAGAGEPMGERPPVHKVRLTAPRRPADLLSRARLVDFIHENIHRKLVLISAAAGYGKSSLLAEFAAETDDPLVWLQLAETDRDLVALIGDLAGALTVRFPSYLSRLPRLAAQPGATPADLALALALEIEQTLDEYFVLALDDFHLVDSVPAVVTFFNTLIDHLPGQAHVVIAGRTLPALQFARLAAKQQIAGLSEEHLRFRPEEVQELLMLRNRVDMPPAAAEALVANTEGWITGILLTTHLLWQGLIANLIEARQAESPLFDYLAAEVLDQQPEPLRQFLMESAVLPVMEPQTCDEVLGRADSAEMLRTAESRRLFVTVVGDDFRAYQYHHLFRDFLHDQLRQQDPARLKSLQARAADWFAANGMPEAAVTYYVQAGELAQAAGLAEAQAPMMYKAGRSATLRRWAEQLAPVAEQTPRLHVYLASADFEAGELRRAERELAVAAEIYGRRGDAAGLLDLDLRRAWALIRRNQYQAALELAQPALARARRLGVAATEAMALRYVGHCLVGLGQAAQAVPALRRSTELLEKTGQHYDLALTLHDLANAYRLRGQTTRASEAQRQALSLMRAEGMVGPLSMLLNDIGWDLHMLGQYEGALDTYAEAIDWARRGGNAHGEVVVTAGRADVLADLGEAGQARVLYRQALAKAEAIGEWALSVYIECGLARQDRRAGNYASALEWLRRAELAADGRQVNLPLANVAGLRGMVLAEMGHLDEGRRLLAETRLALEQSEAPVDLAQTLFFCAWAEFRAGEVEHAVELVDRAMAVGEGIGYDQMLLTEAVHAAELLEACRAWPKLEPRASALLARAHGLGAARARLAARGVILPEPASPRPAQTGLVVKLLGQSLVLRDGREIARNEWSSQRARELFFVLMDGAPLSRDEVLTMFWSDMPQARAVANMHQTIYRMRRAVGNEVVVVDDGGFRLVPGLKLRCDVAQFEALAQAALSFNHSDLRRLGALEAAVALYTGEYLADVTADWASTRRRALAERFVRLLCEYADELLGLTRYAEARATLARALALEPLRDDLHGRMLMCLAALGRRHEMVDHYRRYRETLRTELGLDPPPETRSLYARLIA